MASVCPPARALLVALSLLACVAPISGQAPLNQNVGKVQILRPPPDEFRAVLSIIEEAYKAPREVDREVLDEIRKQYRGQNPDREAKIFREIRRLYPLTPENQVTILTELRQAYVLQTYEQEERVFREIRKGGQLPLGTVPASIQTDEATKLFKKLDQDANGAVSSEEMTDSLREQLRHWDRSGDRVINLEEYEAYYKTSLKVLAEKVASGELNFKGERPSVPDTTRSPIPATPAPVDDARPVIARIGKLPSGLPDWFVKLDKEGDNDGQVGLYEWKYSQKSLGEFTAMDLNSDGLLTAEEFLRWNALPEEKKNLSNQTITQNMDATSDQRSRGSKEPGRDSSDKRFSNSGEKFGQPNKGFGPPMSDGSFGPNKGDKGKGRFGQFSGEGQADNSLDKMFRKKR